MLDASIEPIDRQCLFHVLRYTPDIVRDEWINVGVILFDLQHGALRLKLIEEQNEFARIRRFRPDVDENILRNLKDHLEDRFAAFLRGERINSNTSIYPEKKLLNLVNDWDRTLSNGLQLAPQKMAYADDLDVEMERLYIEYVALPYKETRVGAPGSRASIRNYCAQVWKAGGMWNRLERSVRVSEFTFPGDPMRLDYCYRRNGTRGYVQTLSVSRSPADCKLYAYTAQRIAAQAPFASEFAAVTDVDLEPGNERHSFVRNTLRDAGIEPISMLGFAVWAHRLKLSLG